AKTCGFRNRSPEWFRGLRCGVEGAGATPANTGSLLFDALRVIIDVNAARLSLFALPSNLANVLRRGDAGVGGTGHRARDRLSVSSADQFAPRIHCQVQRANSLRAAAGDFKDSRAECENYTQMAARPRRAAREQVRLNGLGRTACAQRLILCRVLCPQ